MGIVRHLGAAFICKRQLRIVCYAVVVVSVHFGVIIRADCACVTVTNFIFLLGCLQLFIFCKSVTLMMKWLYVTAK